MRTLGQWLAIVPLDPPTLVTTPLAFAVRWVLLRGHNHHIAMRRSPLPKQRQQIRAMNGNLALRPAN